MDGSLLLTEGYKDMKDLTVIIPCFRENEALVTELYNKLSWMGCQVIVVDDGDEMDLQFDHLSHRPNMGYGYAIKQGIKHATTPLICTMDGDGEHNVEDVRKLYTVFNLINNCSMLIGCRWNKKENPIRWIGRKAINFLAVCWSKHMLPDLNSGMRIFRRDLAMGYMPILCDTFSFTTSLTMAIVTDGHMVSWFPIETSPRVYGKSRVKLFRDGLITIFFIFWIGFALNTRKIRSWLRHTVTQ